MSIQFKRSYLASFQQILKPGKYEVQVQTNVTEANLVSDEDGSKPRYIATLKAIAKDKLEQLRQTFAEAEEVDIEQTNGLFMTANIWVKEGVSPDLPMKGETVEVTVDEVPSREGEAVLRVTNIKRKPAEVAKKLDLANFFAPATAQDEATAESRELVHN